MIPALKKPKMTVKKQVQLALKNQQRAYRIMEALPEFKYPRQGLLHLITEQPLEMGNAVFSSSH